MGIGGGAPNANHDARLEDIVLSSRDGEYGGVLQYDFGKTIQEQAFQHTQFLDQPPELLRAAVGGLETQYEADGHKLKEHVAAILEKKPGLHKKYCQPATPSDRLYRSDVVHQVEPTCGKNVPVALPPGSLDHFQASKVMILSFFFDFNNTAKQTTGGMLPSLTFQLSQNSVQSEAQLHRLLQSCEMGQKQPSTGELLNTLRGMLPNPQRVYVGLDALDECTTEKTKLRDGLKAITSISELAHEKLLCTGRPERELFDVFPLLIEEENCVELNEEAIDADIGMYVKERLYKRVEFSRWARYSKMLEWIRDTISSKSDSMFRWTACQLDSLADCLDPAEIETAVRHNLNKTYARMLNKIL